MKNIRLLFTAMLLGFIVNAKASNTDIHFFKDYGNSIIFIENGIEFSIFRDGQFDFNILRHNPYLNQCSVSSNISFNLGYDYRPYLQYDNYGAVVQIENTPVHYDYYGRISRVGCINIGYNNLGYISRVGNLGLFYNRYNQFSHCSGNISLSYTRYSPRPWHRFYRVPNRNSCIVRNRPYRRFYNPIRNTYKRNYNRLYHTPKRIVRKRAPIRRYTPVKNRIKKRRHTPNNISRRRVFTTPNRKSFKNNTKKRVRRRR